MSRGSRRVDALGQRVRERFNEELEYPDEKKTPMRLAAKNLAKAGDNGSSRGDLLSRQSGSHISRVQSAIVSRRSVKQREIQNASITQLTSLKQNEDKESIITLDKLKRFNEAQGTIAGNMTDEMEQAIKAVQVAEEELEGAAAAEEAEEAKDEVAS